MPEGLNRVPDEYSVRRISSETAVVTTKPDSSGRMLSTGWVLREGDWFAARMDELMAASVARPRYGPRR